MVRNWNLNPEIIKLAMSLGLYYFDEISFGKLSEIYNLGQSDMMDFLKECEMPGRKLTFDHYDLMALNEMDGKEPMDGITQEQIDEYEEMNKSMYEKWKDFLIKIHTTEYQQEKHAEYIVQF
ncbi:hypothetical protein ACFOYZ_26445 [Neobacillus cucumis]